MKQVIQCDPNMGGETKKSVMDMNKNRLTSLKLFHKYSLIDWNGTQHNTRTKKENFEIFVYIFAWDH